MEFSFLGKKQKKPLVSIIIPSRDEGENLKKTIESIKEKTDYPNYEIIVVDDGKGGDSRLVRKHFTGMTNFLRVN